MMIHSRPLTLMTVLPFGRPMLARRTRPRRVGTAGSAREAQPAAVGRLVPCVPGGPPARGDGARPRPSRPGRLGVVEGDRLDRVRRLAAAGSAVASASRSTSSAARSELGHQRLARAVQAPQQEQAADQRRRRRAPSTAEPEHGPRLAVRRGRASARSVEVVGAVPGGGRGGVAATSAGSTARTYGASRSTRPATTRGRPPAAPSGRPPWSTRRSVGSCSAAHRARPSSRRTTGCSRAGW